MSLIEVVFVVPIIFSLLLLVVALGRVQAANSFVTGAARDAARAASLQRTEAGARQMAAQAATAALQRDSLACTGGPRVGIDTSRWRPGGSVNVSVTCTATLQDVAFPGLPGSVALEQESTAPLETYRSERSR